jgi:HK97 gp10 family phage protein
MARQRRWSVRVEGAEEIVKMLKGMENEAIKILDNASSKAADPVLQSARNKCPVKLGKLKSSLHKKEEKNRKNTRKSYRVTTKGCRYAMIVECGSKKMAAKPFLRPALDENFSNIRRIINQEIIRGIDNAL